MNGPSSVTADFTLMPGMEPAGRGAIANRSPSITLAWRGPPTLTNFPLLVSVADPNLQITARPDGADILFTASDGVTKLDHEIEQYNSSTGQLTAWVRMPSLSPVSDTFIYIYYGNPAASNQQNAVGVWDSAYKGVWHLPNGTTLSPSDSTANAANGTVNGAVPATAGKIGGGASFSGNTANYMSVGNGPFAALGNSFTMEAWVSSTTTSRKTIFSFNDQAMTPELEINSTAGAIFAIVTGVYEAGTAPGTFPNDGTLHHIVYTKNGPGATHAIYLDGVLQTLTTNVSVTYANPTNPLWIGKRGPATQPWSGVLDELRISTAVRSTSWIATEYNNQSAPAASLTVGAEQTRPLRRASP